MIYIGIFEYDKPLGFLQLSVTFSQGKKLARDIGPFWNCYKKENDLVHQILKKCCYFSDVVLREVLIFLSQQIIYGTNKKKMNLYFDEKFVKAISQMDDIEKSSYKKHLSEFYHYFETGTCRPQELALKTICSLWKDNILLKDNKDLADLGRAESVLYLVSKYRDHLVHTIKVFLLGNYIINKISSIPEVRKVILAHSYGNSVDEKLKHFQELWMLTATFHDFCIPIEYLSKSQRIQYSKFIGAEIKGLLDKAPEDEITKRLFLQNLLITENIIYPIFHVLHYHNPDSTKESQESLKALMKGNYIFDIFEQDIEKFFELKKYGVVHHNILEHFLKNGDHGISSAIRLSKECFPRLGYDEKKDILDKVLGNMKLEPKQRKKFRQEIFKAYFSAIYAIYIHHFIEEKKVYPGVVSFQDNPLAFLLLLCDTIQDWGRDLVVDYKISDRPLGMIEKIDTKNGTVKIVINYEWIIQEEGELVDRIGIGKCKEDPRIKKAKNECEKCTTERDTCIFKEKTISKIKGLEEMINMDGLTVTKPLIELEIKFGKGTSTPIKFPHEYS
jgi:hypothetical protein